MLEAWLALYYSPLIGARRFKKLIDHFGSAENAIEADNHAWKAIGMSAAIIKGRSLSLQEKIDRALQWREISGNSILLLNDKAYPPLLKEIYDPPMVLFVRGSLDILSAPQLAIVGARKPTKEGLYNSQLFATELSIAGLVVTSGLALGIDHAAHYASVKAQKPTIAILGTGLNEIYPKSHIPLSEEIIACGGALVSEYPLHMPPKPHNFPRRNRIIAGLALGTLVVEANLRSGSLITARISMEENREVFTIPGSIHDPQSRGCHQLIREGATLVESTLDIRAALSGWIDPHNEPPQTDLFIANEPLNNPPPKPRIKKAAPSLKALTIAEDHPQKKLYEILKEPKSINQLVEILGLSASEITTDLMMLELEDLITAEVGFYQQKNH